MAAGKFGMGDLAAMGLANVGIGPLNVGNMLDTVEFVRKAWGSLGMPPSFTPTIDLDELDKRIADLKAVEQWLNVNMNMLQGTIQALEIQRGTIATLKAFGEAVSAPVAAVAPAAQALADTALGATLPAAATSEGDPDSAAATPVQAAGTATPPRARKPARPRGKKAALAAGSGALADPGSSAGAWWNLLQEQFNNVANAALSGVGLPHMLGPQAPGAQPAARPAAPGQPAHTKARRTAVRRTAGARPAGQGARKV